MNTDKPITVDLLPRSKVACYRVEDEILTRIRPLAPHSPRAALLAALQQAQAETPPAWCDPAAWQIMAERMTSWVNVFGSLDLWWRLRHKRDE